MATTNVPSRRGLNAIEVIVVVVILAIVALALLMALPRQRETARRAACQKNLMQIGVALRIYDEASGHLPMVPELTAVGSNRGDGPLKAILEELGLASLKGLSDATTRPPRPPGFNLGERSVEGFVCPSDPWARASLSPAPTSYRATTGDAPEGRNGPFAPGRRVSLAEIEAADGTSFTASFAERLLGNNRLHSPDPSNYAVVPGPLDAAGCPASNDSAWRGDAGSSWIASNWTSTLYNHVSRPDDTTSCIADNGRSALLGASSGHPGQVNVLFCDGSVRVFTRGVDLAIWRGLATIQTPR